MYEVMVVRTRGSVPETLYRREGYSAKSMRAEARVWAARHAPDAEIQTRIVPGI